MILASCSSRKESSTTGWEYNNAKNGGYETNERFIEQATGPGLMFVEGGSFTMGRVEQDVMYEWDNIPRRQTVSSFYMDETEVTNNEYKELVRWVRDSVVRTKLAVQAEFAALGATPDANGDGPSGGIQNYAFKAARQMHLLIKSTCMTITIALIQFNL